MGRTFDCLIERYQRVQDYLRYSETLVVTSCPIMSTVLVISLVVVKTRSRDSGLREPYCVLQVYSERTHYLGTPTLWFRNYYPSFGRTGNEISLCQTEDFYNRYVRKDFVIRPCSSSVKVCSVLMCLYVLWVLFNRGVCLPCILIRLPLITHANIHSIPNNGYIFTARLLLFYSHLIVIVKL